MVYLHLATGFEEIEALTIVDVLRRGNIDVKTVSIRDDLEVTGRSGITVKADILFKDADYRNCEMIVLPGGNPGTDNLAKHEGLIRHIKCFAEDDSKLIAAICAAPKILGDLGLLAGKNATIYPGMEEHLKGAHYKKENVVVDGRFITSAGPATTMEFSVKIVEILAGKSMAETVKSGLLMK